MNGKLNKLLWRLMDELDGDGGEGGGAPDAPTPQEPAAPVEDSSAGSGVDWDDLSSDVVEESDELGEAEPPAAPAPAPASETPPAPAEPAQPAAEPPQGVQPAPEAPVEPQQPQQPQSTPEQIQAAERAYAAQLENLYRFDEETALKLQTEPEKVLPALAAKLHLDVMKTVMAQMRGVLPQMLQTQTAEMERDTSAKQQFFGAWPELKGYEQQVLQVGMMFRQLNPKATAEEAVQRIGELAMTSLGLSRQAPPAAPPVTPPSAFQPAVPGRVNPPAAPTSLWEEMAFDDDD